MLELKECSFTYPRGGRPALQEVSVRFDVERTVLLGPNGAGKSTLLAVAAGARRPNKGTVRANDRSPQDGRRSRRAYLESVAWLPQSVAPVPGCTVREQVALHGWLKGMSRTAAWDGAETALQRVRLKSEMTASAKALSGGQQARMGLAQALVHDARVLLLDEPTAALDPAQRARFVDLLAELAPDRVVVVSTHDVAELESSYDRVVVMRAGKIRHDSSVHDFLSTTTDRLTPLAAYRRVTDDL